MFRQSAVARLDSGKAKSVELVALVLVAMAPGGHVDDSIHPRRRAVRNPEMVNEAIVARAEATNPAAAE